MKRNNDWTTRYPTSKCFDRVVYSTLEVLGAVCRLFALAAVIVLFHHHLFAQLRWWLEWPLTVATADVAWVVIYKLTRD